MNESKLRTIEQIERFLAGNSEVEFSGYENDAQRYAHLSRVLKRFDYPKCVFHVIVTGDFTKA